MKQQQLYGFYTKNILLQETYLQKIEEKKEPGLFSRIWNWKPKKDYLAFQLLREWSIHGTKYVVQPERHLLERIFWAITVLCSTGVACFFSYEIVKKYLSSPVIVSFQPAQTSVSEVPFPAVTICNVNLFKKSVIKESLNRVLEAAAKNEDLSTVLPEVILLKEMNHLCQATKSFSSKFNLSLGESTLNILLENKTIAKYMEQISILTIDETRVPEHAKRFQDALQPCHEMIHLCMWEGEEFDCKASFIPMLTDSGICCRFNMMPNWLLQKQNKSDNPHELITDEEIKSWKQFNLDAALMGTDDDSHHEEEGKYPRHQSKAGQSSGLSVMLYPDQPEYFCTTHDAYGYKIFAHSPIEFPHVLEYGLAVGPNREVFVNLQAEVTVADEQLRKLDSEERYCYFLNEKHLENYLHYTASNCIDECIMNKTIAECGCITYDMQQATKTDRTRYCENMTCAAGIRRQIGSKGTKYFCKKCYPSCNRILYDTHTSSLPIRTDIDIWKSEGPQERKDWTNLNVSIVHVYFGSDSVYTKVRKPLFGFSELFANVGGILGLFIGFSVISLVEPVYFLFRLVRYAFTKAKDENETLVEKY